MAEIAESNRPIYQLPSADQIAKVIDPVAFDPPNHWTLGTVKAAQKHARDRAERLLLLLTPNTDPAGIANRLASAIRSPLSNTEGMK